MTGKILRVLVLGVAFALFFTVASCDDSISDGQCLDTDTACGTFTTCCDTDGCAYEANGRVFPCDGFDCGQAAEDLAEFMCSAGGGSSVAAEALNMSQDLSR